MLTKKQLKQVLHYNPDTGIFTWLIKISGVKPGDIAGTKRKHDGKTYILISINGKKYRAHRLAFLYMIGRFPIELVDHEDGDGINNKWNNIRETDPVNNNRNMRLRVDNTSGVPGVYWNKKDKRWQVSIKVGEDRGYIGQYADYFEAVCARKSAENFHGFHENHGQVRPL